MENNTIAAICTAQGNGAISIIRISGKDTYNIVAKIFSPLKKNFNFETQSQGNKFYNGYIIDNNGKTIDRVVVFCYKNPHSYTGEDTIEISCHASIYIQRQILKIVLENGAQPAQPGEFTQRAYMNGKMDLSQAEAVADLIASKSAAEHNIAINQMRGGITNEIKRLRDLLLKFTSLMELELDFSEEDVEFADRSQLREILNETKNYLKRLINSFAVGNAIKNGIPVAIAGQPNAGKSTLLNALLNDERAIVSDIPGTTRDSIEDSLIINGITYRLIDTAGIRNTSDTIEKLGIDRAKNAVEKAEIVILVVDPMTDIYKQYQDVIPSSFNGKLIIAINKLDIKSIEIDSQKFPDNTKIIKISAKHKENIDLLLNTISEFSQTNYSTDDVILTNLRHYEIFREALDSIERGETALNSGLSGEFVSQDIREALRLFGDITGDEITPNEVLGNIFKNFCIGK
ncbi:MAG: tRNA uridine-5-carboxymethylaminomethyl(34) synthesis GTPase MnmE [Bacteroidales bacterium]|nr:tRNA uridine-5-carboxymethylaminomethyl(34) synthesis GTPase MnmE [Bacteroidales bacterium]